MLKLKNNETYCIACACVFVLSFALNVENLIFGSTAGLSAVLSSLFCPLAFLLVLFRPKQNRTFTCEVVLLVYSCILTLVAAVLLFTTLRNPDWADTMMLPILVFVTPFYGIYGLLHILPVEEKANLLLFLLLFAMSFCGVAVSAKNLTQSKAK